MRYDQVNPYLQQRIKTLLMMNKGNLLLTLLLEKWGKL